MGPHRLHWIYYRLRALQQNPIAPDKINPTVISFLSVIGIALIYSIQQGYCGAVKWHQQSLWFMVGFVIYGLTACIHYKFFFQNAHWFYLLSLIALILIWTPLGQNIGGSWRWINAGVWTLQPSDFSKIAILIMAASHLARATLSSVKETVGIIGRLTLIGGIPFFLIFIQPDFGSALLIPILLLSLGFVANIKLRFFAGLAALSLMGFGLVALDEYAYCQQLQQKASVLKPFLPLKNYQRNRLLSFVAPKVVDPNGTTVGWQLKQSLIAIGSGGIGGKGWLQNTQSKLGFLPRATSLDDFIFSVLAEETGLWGTYFVFVLYGILILNTLRIAFMAGDLFGCYVCVGIAVLMAVHIWINVGMTLGIMPITGISAPFLSYGGSFMVVCFFAQGLVQSVYRFRLSE